MTNDVHAEPEQVSREEAIAFAVAAIEQTGAEMYHTSLAPSSASEFMSGEAPSVVITKEDGRWWLKVEDQAGSSDYPTLEKAKIAAAEVVVDSDETRDSDIVRSLRIDPEEWEVTFYDGNICLKSKNGIREIVGSNVTETWSLYEGDDLIYEDDDFSAVLHSSSPSAPSVGLKI